MIPYDELTYGDLISEVKKEGLKLCSQIKLQYQVKKDLKASRKDLGSFIRFIFVILKFFSLKRSFPIRFLFFRNLRGWSWHRNAILSTKRT